MPCATKQVMVKKILTISSLLFVLSIQASENPYQSILNMMSKEKSTKREAASNLLRVNNLSYAPAMVDALFFIPRSGRKEMFEVLEKLTGHNAGNDYYNWVEYIGKKADLKSPPGYIKFKATLLSLIDPSYKKILYTGVPLKIRAEEIVWGGVSLDGIPPIDRPTFIAAEEARLKDKEKVFGISIRGEARAYPLRYLSWHEMVNDRIQGEPFTISY